MPNTEDLLLQLAVSPVDDFNPGVVVNPADSRTRVVTLAVVQDDVQLMEAVWLVAEH